MTEVERQKLELCGVVPARQVKTWQDLVAVTEQAKRELGEDAPTLRLLERAAELLEPPLERDQEVATRLAGQDVVIEAARSASSGGGGATFFNAQEVRTLLDIIEDRERLFEKGLRNMRRRHAAIARWQPFYPDTNRGVRQAWVREQIARRIEGNPERTTDAEAERLAKQSMEALSREAPTTPTPT